MSTRGVRVVARAAGTPRHRGRAGAPWLAVAAIAGALLVLAAVALAVASSGPRPATSTAVTLRAASDAGVNPGPTRLVGGVATGFARSPAGAEAAAARMDLTLTRLLDSGGGAALVNAGRAYAAPAYVETLTGVLSRDGDYEQRNPNWTSDTRVRRVVIGTQLAGYSPSRATVRCWQMAFITQGAPPVVEKWFTDTIQLDWFAGDWKMSRFVGTTPGPGPVAGSEQATVQALSSFDGAGDASATG